MPRRATPQITAWSFSRWSQYNTCPRQLKLSAIDKHRIKQNAAMKRGSDIHTLAEKYVIGELPAKMPAELDLFDEEFKAARKAFRAKKYEVLVEQKWAFTKDWVPCGYFDKQCWVRVVVDLAILNRETNVLTIIDHKTGKVRPEHRDQLRLYGCAGFSQFPGIPTVKAELWYLDQGIINDDSNEPVVFEADEHDELIEDWAKKTKALLSDKTFKPNPSNLCTWCDFSQQKGGQCEF